MAHAQSKWSSLRALEKGTLALAHALQAASEDGGGWFPEDFGPILCHQLNSPIGADLIQLVSEEGGLPGGQSAQTFGALLFDASPSPGMLLLVKNLAKQLMEEKRFAYPKPVATVLYFASIASACLGAGVSISSLSPAEIRQGFQWARKREWIPPRLALLFEEALRRMASSPLPPFSTG